MLFEFRVLENCLFISAELIETKACRKRVHFVEFESKLEALFLLPPFLG